MAGSVAWSYRLAGLLILFGRPRRSRFSGFIGNGDLSELNWRPRIDAVQKCFNSWHHCSLSCGGRALVSNALTPSCIWYAASLVSTPSWALRELNTALLNVFWGGKKDLVAFNVVIHHREDEGFQLVSFPSLAKCIPSLPSGSSVCVFLLVSLLTFWCYNRFDVDPVFVFHTLIHVYPAFAAFLCFLARFLELLENVLEKVRATLFPPLSKQLFFFSGRAVVKVGVGVSWLNSRVVGLV